MSLSVVSARASSDSVQADFDLAMGHLLGYALVKANLQMRDRFEQSIRQPLGLSPVEFTLLTALVGNSGLTQKVLAGLLRIQPPNLTVIVARLTRKGLLQKVRNRDDGRSHLLQLTTEGKALQSRAYRISLHMEAPATEQLSEAERATLLDLLGRIGQPGREN
ncbi:MAG: MarR family winged helix-turn-helix transcriptional regulator [Burkholderiaceae bacterium]